MGDGVVVASLVLEKLLEGRIGGVDLFMAMLRFMGVVMLLGVQRRQRCGSSHRLRLFFAQRAITHLQLAACIPYATLPMHGQAIQASPQLLARLDHDRLRVNSDQRWTS